MKKQLFIALLASTLIVSSISMTAFAATNTTTSSAVTTTDAALITTTGAVTTTTAAVTTTGSAITDASINTDIKEPETVAPIKLSLDAAYKKMLADSPEATLAKWTKDREVSIAKGYSEQISKMNKLEKDVDAGLTSSWALDTSNKEMLRANRTFGVAQAPKNYEASINSLKSSTYEMYYNYKYSEVQVQVAKDNLDRTQKIYDSTMLKYKLGTVSKLDTLTAETTLNTAKDNYTLAFNGFEQMKMNFNLFMGYNIHQKIALTDTLSALDLPTKSIDDSIKDALITRNEINDAQHAAEMCNYALDNVKAYPKNSATYMSAKSSLLIAEENLKKSPGTVEIDVRTKYMDMKQKYDAVKSGKISYENSKEASRLGQLQYDSGIITVTDLSGINLNTFNTQQAYYKAILDYNLAVNAYNLASGVGTNRATI